MTNTQKHLLKLIKEIDEICRKNGIVYYLAGGSAIGAIRHRGFIPWDDDADILMTRSNYHKFLEVCKTQLPKNRRMLCPELNREYHNNFARYIDVTTTAIHTNQIVHDDAAGFVVDILVLDPIPDSPKEQKKYIKYLELYADLINPMTIYSFRWRMNFLNYYLYRLKILMNGKDKVLKELELKMFSYDEEKCNKYILRWAGVPLISDKDLYGIGSDYWFEGIKVMLPQKAAGYLTWHYGSDWMFLPPHAERSTHNAVYCFDTPYEIIKRESYQYYDINTTRQKFLIRKLFLFLAMYPWWFYKDILAKRIQHKLSKKYTRYFQNREENIKLALETKKYGILMKYYQNYFLKQNRKNIIGREDYSGINRFRFPIYIKIPNDFFIIGLRLLIIVGDTSKALRFLTVKEQKNSLCNEEKKLKEYILNLEKSISCFANKDYTRSLELIKLLLKEDVECVSTIKLYVRLLQKINEKDKNEKILEAIRFGEELTKHIYSTNENIKSLIVYDGEWIKYRADIQNDVIKKINGYLFAYPITSNGIVKLEIKDYIEENYDLIINRLEELYEKKNICCISYIEKLRLILPKDDKVNALWAKYQNLKKISPEKMWGIINELRKFIEKNSCSDETMIQLLEYLEKITKDTIVSKYYSEIIFTKSIDKLENLMSRVNEMQIDLEWKQFLNMFILFKCGKRRESIQQSISLYRATTSNYIKYILRLIFQLDLLIISNNFVHRTDEIENEDLLKRNNNYIEEWKKTYSNFEDTIQMYKYLEVFTKNEIELFQINAESKFDSAFFMNVKRNLKKRNLNLLDMIEKIYGLSFYYDRNEDC